MRAFRLADQRRRPCENASLVEEFRERGLSEGENKPRRGVPAAA